MLSLLVLTSLKNYKKADTVTKGKNTKLYILGSSLFAEEIADYIRESDSSKLGGFIEGIDYEKCNQTLQGYPVLWLDDIPRLGHDCRGICAVGSPKRKGFIYEAKEKGLSFTTFVHSSVHKSSSTIIGLGSIIGAGSIIAVNTSIGEHTIINRGCLIGHHVEIGNFVTVSPGANIAGRTVIGDQSYIGMGAIIRDGISIGKNVIVGAGAVVTKDIPDSVQVVGMPARIVKELN